MLLFDPLCFLKDNFRESGSCEQLFVESALVDENPKVKHDAAHGRETGSKGSSSSATRHALFTVLAEFFPIENKVKVHAFVVSHDKTLSM